MNRKRIIFIIAPIIGIFVILLASWLTMVYALTPANLRKPEVAHHHFRLQLTVEGEYIDFAGEDFQEAYTPGICANGLTETPIHFHDNVGQIVHIHWSNITGGQVLKYYGLNRVGGFDSILGYRIDESLIPKTVSIKDKIITDPGSKMWVYVGDESNYEVKDANDFLNQDLETFFNKKSKLTESRESVSKNPFEIHTQAHGQSFDKSTEMVAEENIRSVDFDEVEADLTQEELEELNDLIGNVVIFIQDSEPDQSSIREKFNNLQQLENSQCGG